MTSLIVTGTDTGIGKTIVAAGLTAALGASYWKPVQAGLDSPTDSELVAELTGAPILPEAYRLIRPASPHLSAEEMGVTIDPEQLHIPQVDGPLVIEGAGGVMVPLTRKRTFLDLFARWDRPIVLVARTSLGTINHTALSLAALRAAGCAVVGVLFNGPPEPEVEDTIINMFETTHLGRLPPLAETNGPKLQQAMTAIRLDRIREAL